MEQERKDSVLFVSITAGVLGGGGAWSSTNVALSDCLKTIVSAKIVP